MNVLPAALTLILSQRERESQSQFVIFNLELLTGFDYNNAKPSLSTRPFSKEDSY